MRHLGETGRILNKQNRICRVGHSDSPPMTAISTPDVLAAARTRALNASNPSPGLRSSCVSPTLPYVGSPPSRPPRMIISVGSFCVVRLSSADRRACHLCVSPSSQPGFAPPILPGALRSRLAQGCAADIPLGHQERDPHPVSGTRSRPLVRLRQRPLGRASRAVTPTLARPWRRRSCRRCYGSSTLLESPMGYWRDRRHRLASPHQPRPAARLPG